jgi:hypothetical protein
MSLASSRAFAAETVQLTAVDVEPYTWRTNLLSNPSFEETRADGIPIGWQWDRRNTDAACVTDRTRAHRGRQSIFLTNGTEFGAHVYGMLWRMEPLRLVEGTAYTMSAWVTSEAPGIVSLIGGSDWQFRVQAEATGGQWRRMATTFTPGPKDCDFTLRISTESKTRGVWIDDVKLEEGSGASIDPPDAAADGRSTLEANEGERVVEGDGPFSVAFTLVEPRSAPGTWVVTLSSGETLRRPARVSEGLWRVFVRGEATAALDAPRCLTLRWEAPEREPSAATATVRFYSASNVIVRAASLRGRLPALDADLTTLASRGVDVSYPRVTAAVLENFVAYVEEDARHGEVRRALEQLADMEPMATRVSRELKEALAGTRRLAAVPRWTGDRRPAVKSSSFLAPVRMPGGAVMERPVFFNGYGHFGRVVSDLEKWPSYGTNIIQIEVGPSRIFPAEGVTDGGPVRELVQTLDRARKSGVAVCLLVSPHYFPEWALAKWPHLRVHRDGFLKYCLHAPEGQELLQRFLAVLLPPLKDHPALHSICLSNEPVNAEEPCESARRQWEAWLSGRHGNIKKLNSICGSHFASFAAVPLPSPFGPRPAQPLWWDFIRFNQDFFADWHAKMADAIRAAAPGLPVHAKAMTWTMLGDGDLKYGVEATLFGSLSDINGNDSVDMFDFGDGEFAQGWQLNAMSHDLQRSVRDAPVFNTENHLITDRDTRLVPAAHIRAALWQAAVHGQSATTIWVWERTFDPKSDFAGSIMHRPACAEAVGIVNHDLNRAAPEITAIQQARPQALLLKSVTASVWDGGSHSECLGKLYTALSFTGLTLGFVTERQLEAGLVPEAPVVFIPNVSYLSASGLASLRRFKGKVVLVGEGELLTHDEYGRPSAATLPGEKLSFRPGATSARDLHAHLPALLTRMSLRPAVELRRSDGQPVWGVEWRCAETQEGLVASLCNYLKQATNVTVSLKGRNVVIHDVLARDRTENPLTLAPLEVRLLRVESAPPSSDEPPKE